jgi:hypothetical protein
MFTREEDLDFDLETKEMNPPWNESWTDFSIDAVKRKLECLKEDKSPGPNQMHPMLLKNCADSVSEPLGNQNHIQEIV